MRVKTYATVAVIAAAGFLAVKVYLAHVERLETERLLKETEAQSEARAKALGLTRLQVEGLDELTLQLRDKLRLAAADAKTMRAKLLLVGSTPTHTLSDTPSEVGPVEVTNHATAGVVALPDGRPYVKGEVETTVELPKWGYRQTFKEPLVFEQAVLAESTARACPSSEEPVALDRFRLSDTPTLPPIRKYHLGRGFVCGIGLIGGVVAYPPEYSGFGAGFGGACVFGFGVVR